MTPPNLEGVDRIIHEPGRLMSMAMLYVVTSTDFTFLIAQTGLSWGNLSTHISKLEEAGYIQVVKDFAKHRPHTMLRLTEAGRAAFREYRQPMKQVLDDLPD